MLLIRFLPLLVLLAAAGCSSKLIVSEISNTLDPGSSVHGIPFRVAKRYDATLYEKTADGYKPVYKTSVTLPARDRLFVLGFEGQLFSNGSVDLTLNSDGTIQQVSLKSTSRGADVLTAAGTQLAAVATAVESRRTASQTAVTSRSTAAIAAEEARQAAELAELHNRTTQANPASTAEDLLKAAQAERLAKIKANEAARLAGLPAPFPGFVAGAP